MASVYSVDAGADAAEQLALAVFEIFCHHGAVQIEIDRVNRHLLRQLSD